MAKHIPIYCISCGDTEPSNFPTKDKFWVRVSKKYRIGICTDCGDTRTNQIHFNARINYLKFNRKEKTIMKKTKIQNALAFIFIACLVAGTLTGCDKEDPVSSKVPVQKQAYFRLIQSVEIRHSINGTAQTDYLQGTHVTYDIHDTPRFIVWNGDEVVADYVASKVKYVKANPVEGGE